MARTSSVLATVVILVLVIAATARAQSTAAIGGVVKDATGGVLPGVTVEATSPALIEKSRSVVTNETGQYKIVDLRPGIYTATFSLTGFNTIKREAIELISNFTATVNAEMRVGAMEETITVSGASPIVDVQNVLQQRVMTRDVLDAIPSGKYYQNLGALIPGVVLGQSLTNSTQDVGGSLGNQSITMSIHGSRQRDQQVLVDGMNVTSLARNDTTLLIFQDGNTEELSLLVGVNPAESEAGGVRVNVIPKEGGNAFKGSIFANFTNSRLQTGNVDDSLRAAGLTSPNRMKRLYDFNPSMGGPIVRDTLWFYGSFRRWLGESFVAGEYYNQDPKAWIYAPDLTRQGVLDQIGNAGNLRLTWQASARNKFTAYYDYNTSCDCHREASSVRSPEATLRLTFKNNLSQFTWTSPVTGRLLLEAGTSILPGHASYNKQDESTEDPVTEQSSGMSYRARPTGPFHNPPRNYNQRASISYVTGSHAVKAGFTLLFQSLRSEQSQGPGDVAYRLLNGMPNQVTYYATPYEYEVKVDPNLGIFLQDQWSVKHLTVNVGLRFDSFSTSNSDMNLEATRWMPARNLPGGDVLKWTDLSPRLSMAYDLFGKGKTAVKASLSRYVLQEGLDLTSTVNPVIASNNTSARTWNDINGDFIVQGDALNPAANGELGPHSNANFGKTVLTTRLNPDMARGVGKRPYNWEASAGVQHELLPRVSVNAAYFRRWFGNFLVTDSLAATSQDYDPYCITAPVDPRLPRGGGDQICGLFDINPLNFGRVDNFRTLASNFGNRYEHWSGMDLTMNARLPKGILLQGGLSTGKTLTDDCDVVVNLDNPSTRFCHQETPFLTQIKFLGSYPLPWWGLQMSGTFQSIPGNAVQANYVATSAVIRPSLGRNLSSGANGTVTIPLIQPSTMYADRINQLDVRATKEFRVGTKRLRGMVDLYNLLNSNTVLTVNNAYGTNGSSWLVPQVVLPGRLVKFATQVTF